MFPPGQRGTVARSGARLGRAGFNGVGAGRGKADGKSRVVSGAVGASASYRGRWPHERPNAVRAVATGGRSDGADDGGARGTCRASEGRRSVAAGSPGNAGWRGAAAADKCGVKGRCASIGGFGRGTNAALGAAHNRVNGRGASRPSDGTGAAQGWAGRWKTACLVSVRESTTLVGTWGGMGPVAGGTPSGCALADGRGGIARDVGGRGGRGSAGCAPPWRCGAGPRAGSSSGRCDGGG